METDIDPKLSGCKVIDLFCGIGGLSYGFKTVGFKIIAGYDNDDSCQFAFESNNDSLFITKDIREVSSNELLNLYTNTKIKILVGCAPCQPFSSYSYKSKEANNDKWSLLYEFGRLIKEVAPDIVSMENVPQLVNFKKAPVFENFINTLKLLGYFVSYQVVNCPEYGLPQNRKRLVLLASKFGEIQLIEKTHKKGNFRTVQDIIKNLPLIKDGEASFEDPFHVSRKLTAINRERIRNTPSGGSWKDWPKSLILKCHNKESGKTYPSVYGRMKWNQPSPTITTQCIGYGNGRFGHPEQDRAISLREAALLQTFPQDYKFVKDGKRISSVVLARQLGNAVPVDLGKVIAKSIKQHLIENSHV